MSSTFKIGVESKEEKKKTFTNEAEAIESIFLKKEGSKFETCRLEKFNEITEWLSQEFKEKLQVTVSTPPNSEGKRQNFLYNGFRYGVNYKEDLDIFSVWRMKSEGQQGSGSGQYRQKATVLYNLQQIYEGEVDSVNDILDRFNEKKDRYEQISLVNVFPNKDGKLIYVMKKDKVVILGQEQQPKEEPKKEEVAK